MSRAREADSHRHAGQWVLLDARVHLLAIGKDPYPGTSPRTTLDLTARRVLLPQMRAVSASGLQLTEVVNDLGRRWSVRVEPLLGAFSGQSVAVLGCYWPAGAAEPARPLVGCWEWQVTPPGPDQQMHGYWSPSLFQVYEMTVPSGPHRWEGPQWLDEVVMEADRADTRRIQEDLFTATSDALRFHVLRVRSPESGRVFRIRMAGRREVTEPGPGIWLRGVSMRIDSGGTDIGPAPGPPSYLEAMLALARDPVCAIDTDYEQMFLTSDRFAELYVALPPDRYLPRMCHPDDLAALREMLAEATTNLGAPVGPVRIRFAAQYGGWKSLDLTGAGVWHSSERPHHVLCRVSEVVLASRPNSPPNQESAHPGT